MPCHSEINELIQLMANRVISLICQLHPIAVPCVLKGEHDFTKLLHRKAKVLQALSHFKVIVHLSQLCLCPAVPGTKSTKQNGQVRLRMLFKVLVQLAHS